MARARKCCGNLSGTISPGRDECSQWLCLPVYDQRRCILHWIGLSIYLTSLPLHTTRCTRRQLFGEIFTNPNFAHLVDRVWVAETPSLVNVRLPDFITRITTTAFRRHPAVAGTTVPVGSGVVHLFQFVLKRCRMWVRNYISSLGKTCFDNIVGYITLSLATNVHNIDTEY